MDATYIISKFGGVRPMARLMGCPPSTVQNWETRENIPSKQQSKILEIGIENGIDIKPDDFFKKNLDAANAVNPNKS